MNRDSSGIDPSAPRSSLTIGDFAIDGEHEALFRMFQRLRDAPADGAGPGGFHDVLSELGSVLFAHFEHEEVSFKHSGMPVNEVQGHLRAHREIVHQYAELSLSLMHKEGIDREDVITLIHEWILHHLIQYDLKMRPHVADRSPS